MCDFDVGYMSLMLVVWVGMWLCEFDVGYMGRNVVVWIRMWLYEFDVGYVGLMEWEEERKIGKIEMGEKEGIDLFILFVDIVYIILISCM